MDQNNNEFNYSRHLYEIVSNRLLETFKPHKEFDDVDIKLINFFRDIIQAKTLKYVTQERLKEWNEIDIKNYINTKCVTQNSLNEKKMQFSFVTQRIGKFQNNQVNMSLYRNRQCTEGDYF